MTINKTSANNNVVYTVDYLWVIIPGVAYSSFVSILRSHWNRIYLCSSTVQYEGTDVWNYYVLFGLGASIQTALSTPFLNKQPAWEKTPLKCGIWYFMLQGVIVIVDFVAAAVIIKKYKL